MINRELIASEWLDKVVPVHPVPQKLFDHQMDAMSLIKQGKNVFLGTNCNFKILINRINTYLFRSPDRVGQDTPAVGHNSHDARYQNINVKNYNYNSYCDEYK